MDTHLWSEFQSLGIDLETLVKWRLPFLTAVNHFDVYWSQTSLMFKTNILSRHRQLDPTWRHEQDTVSQTSQPTQATRMDANHWGSFKSALTRVINLAIIFTKDMITADTVEEARTLLTKLKERYDALEDALGQCDPTSDFEKEMEAIQTQYTKTKSTSVGCSLYQAITLSTH